MFRSLALLAILAAPAAADDGVKLGGYLEAYDSYNFAGVQVSNLRAFDDRAASITLQNAVVEATWTKGPVSGRIALQYGEAGDLYYQAEPLLPATGTAPANSGLDWRHVQEAWVQWDIHCVQLAAGLFLSPIGTEDLAEKDDWSWSRSNLFVALPFYHVGAKATAPIGDGWKAIAGIYNGWNDAVDGNRVPSVSAAVAYEKKEVQAQVLYFGGIERPTGDPDGRPWRHLFDAYIQLPVGAGFSLGAQGDLGFERGSLATTSWQAAAGYARYDLTKQVWFAARADVVREPRTSASAILIPVALLASGTITAGYRPVDGLELRADLRHDHGSDPTFFVRDGSLSARTQNTATLGVLAWF